MEWWSRAQGADGARWMDSLNLLAAGRSWSRMDEPIRGAPGDDGDGVRWEEVDDGRREKFTSTVNTACRYQASTDCGSSS